MGCILIPLRLKPQSESIRVPSRRYFVLDNVDLLQHDHVKCVTNCHQIITGRNSLSSNAHWHASSTLSVIANPAMNPAGTTEYFQYQQYQIIRKLGEFTLFG